jgi:hypothetical protein
LHHSDASNEFHRGQKSLVLLVGLTSRAHAIKEVSPFITFRAAFPIESNNFVACFPEILFLSFGSIHCEGGEAANEHVMGENLKSETRKKPFPKRIREINNLTESTSFHGVVAFNSRSFRREFFRFHSRAKRIELDNLLYKSKQT